MGHRMLSLTGIPGVKNMLFADDLSLPSNEHADLRTMLNKLRVYAERKSLTVSTQKSEVMCFNSNSENLLPLYFDGVLLPYTDIQMFGHGVQQADQSEYRG